MLHYENDSVEELLLKGDIGLEKESLRVTENGELARTKDPFPNDRHIVKDFCENQVEVNTDTWPDAEGAIGELEHHTKRVRDTIKTAGEPEYLWPFSNPPYLTDPKDVPIAQYYGETKEKTVYREYLAKKYGTYLMTFSGIHVNFSFSEKLLRTDFSVSQEGDYRQYKNEVYLRLAEQMLRYGWILNILTSASPVLDGSYFRKEDRGKDVITNFASVRCSEKGYWNTFIPVMNYDSTDAYVDSIGKYVQDGVLWAPSELYFPIRLKAGTKYTLEHLRTGWTHIEIRTFDLNPLVPEGLDKKDVKFAELLMIWLACQKPKRMTEEEKVRAVDSFKRAAHLHPEKEPVISENGRETVMTDEAKRVITEMAEFYDHLEMPVGDVLSFELQKIEHPEKRYAFQVLERYTNGFVEKGLARAKELTKGGKP